MIEVHNQSLQSIPIYMNMYIETARSHMVLDRATDNLFLIRFKLFGFGIGRGAA